MCQTDHDLRPSSIETKKSGKARQELSPRVRPTLSAAESPVCCYLSFSLLVASTLVTVFSSCCVLTLTEKPAFRSSNLHSLPSKVISAVAGMMWLCCLPCFSFLVSFPSAGLSTIAFCTFFASQDLLL